ncbi:ATP-binding protein [Comamonas sp. PE63]|nr:ATP-binding protein [Comamonas sp. PE63]
MRSCELIWSQALHGDVIGSFSMRGVGQRVLSRFSEGVSGMESGHQESPSVEQALALEKERRQALLAIASGAPIKASLEAVTEAVGRLIEGARACVMFTDVQHGLIKEGHSRQFPPLFIESLKGLSVDDEGGWCGAQALQKKHYVVCHRSENTGQTNAAWNAICDAHDIDVCCFHPALDGDGKGVGIVLLALPAVEPGTWECRVAEFAALAVSLAVTRIRASEDLYLEIDALARLQQLSSELVGKGELEPLLHKILAAAADISGTDKGNIQIFDPVRNALRIVVHQGLGARMVEHFRYDGWDASCGEAAARVQRLVVEDVDQLDGLEGTPGLEIIREDGIRSIQCTPLVSRDGRLLGMLNNHYRQVGGPTPEALRYIDLLARQAAELIERHQTEAELATERQRKDEFLAMLAHELRNPLAPLRNMLEVQKRANGDAGLMMGAREVMERQLLQLVRLVDDLLDVNRINRGKLELRFEPVLLESVVNHALEVCRHILDERRHRLQVLLPKSPLMLNGDAARLTQVFGNLLTNAAKYTPPGGAIRLHAEVKEDCLEVLVLDNGTGIPADQLETIFEVFTQVDRTRERSQGGLGIGLMLVKRLVEMHGGQVQAFSDGLGKGSEFVVRLPLKECASARQLPSKQAPGRPCRILIVDDSQDAAHSLAMLLSQEGHETHVACDGPGALEVGPVLRPDVILMDIGMPGMNGHEVCRRIREQEWGRRTLIIAVTGWGQDKDRRESEQAGFDAHMVKPVRMPELQNLLASGPKDVPRTR